MKLWSGRFSKETDNEADIFNSSIGLDKRLVFYDIKGSVAHVAMLEKQNIIDSQEAQMIISSLKQLEGELERGETEIGDGYEDIHMAIEEILTERIGEPAKRMHTARSRNDQVALDMRMYALDASIDIIESLEGLVKILGRKALGHLDTVMPGYTHMQKAQPVTLAHHFCAYIEMFLRDISRFEDCKRRMDYMPLGSGALAASTFDIDREFVAKQLGFSGLTKNSMDSVADRDYLIELCFCVSLAMMHLSRFCEEIVLWSTEEFGFVSVSDAFSTGSSMMPQKKNPDMAELIRGKAGRSYGELMALLTMMKGLPMTYNKDMQEDKQAVFSTVDNVLACVSIFGKMIATADFKPDTMRKSAYESFVCATDLAEHLTKNGMPFRDAHYVVGKLVKKCIDEDRLLFSLTIDELQRESEYFGEDAASLVDPERSLDAKSAIGSPNKELVESYLKNILA
ncbi:MAG: argininosuccinate lyase [Eubacteriaceae bacterium]|nr:argininosuccinate lyase [Eubacteriaceae bacterium]